MNPLYRATDETLQGIILGLDPQPHDQILSICGSGDQAFALLENAGIILAIDYNISQIAFAQYRKNKLKQQEESEFLGLPNLPFGVPQPKRPHCYFTQEKLDKIRCKLDHLEFQHNTLHEALPKKQWSKVYLSNITMGKNQNPFWYWKQVAMCLTKDGLVYHASASQTSISSNINLKQWHPFWPADLILDHEHTHQAQQHSGYYHPVVFRKI